LPFPVSARYCPVFLEKTHWFASFLQTNWHYFGTGLPKLAIPVIKEVWLNYGVPVAHGERLILFALLAVKRSPIQLLSGALSVSLYISLVFLWRTSQQVWSILGIFNHKMTKE
jgi:hypothetical protein